jgi:hypothetical protein
VARRAESGKTALPPPVPAMAAHLAAPECSVVRYPQAVSIRIPTPTTAELAGELVQPDSFAQEPLLLHRYAIATTMQTARRARMARVSPVANACAARCNAHSASDACRMERAADR